MITDGDENCRLLRWDTIYPLADHGWINSCRIISWFDRIFFMPPNLWPLSACCCGSDAFIPGAEKVFWPQKPRVWTPHSLPRVFFPCRENPECSKKHFWCWMILERAWPAGSPASQASLLIFRGCFYNKYKYLSQFTFVSAYYSTILMEIFQRKPT